MAEAEERRVGDSLKMREAAGRRDAAPAMDSRVDDPCPPALVSTMQMDQRYGRFPRDPMEEDRARRERRRSVGSWSATTTTDTAGSRWAAGFSAEGETRVGSLRAHRGRHVVLPTLRIQTTPW